MPADGCLQSYRGNLSLASQAQHCSPTLVPSPLGCGPPLQTGEGSSKGSWTRSRGILCRFGGKARRKSRHMRFAPGSPGGPLPRDSWKSFLTHRSWNLYLNLLLSVDRSMATPTESSSPSRTNCPRGIPRSSHGHARMFQTP